jgi:hypothetical protein
MQADIDNKNADSALKREALRWEPWKAMAAAFGAGAAFTAAVVAIVTLILAHIR